MPFYFPAPVNLFVIFQTGYKTPVKLPCAIFNNQPFTGDGSFHELFKNHFFFPPFFFPCFLSGFFHIFK